MTVTIFLNYRRGNSSGSAGRLFDVLQQHLPNSKIFMDVDSIEPGIDFITAIEQQLLTCDYFIAVIGPGWADTQDADGGRRLDDPNDNVRLEITAALRREIRVVPVLVEGAKMPSAEDLPEALRPLSRRNAYEITHHSFVDDVRELCNKIKRSLAIEADDHTTTSTTTKQGLEPSWAEILFSYKGRLSRGKFWVWNAPLLIVTLAIQIPILMVLGDSPFSTIVKEEFVTTSDSSTNRISASLVVDLGPCCKKDERL